MLVCHNFVTHFYGYPKFELRDLVLEVGGLITYSDPTLTITRCLNHTKNSSSVT